MSLLQIAEPGQTVTKGACRLPAIGIDLGTTNSLVAWVADGTPVVVHPQDESALLPSVVHYGQDGEVIVGDAAHKLASSAPGDTIRSVKRFVGRGPDDTTQERALTPYEFDDGDKRLVRFRVNEGRRIVSAVEVSAEILKALARRAEATLGSFDGAVITVPAYFDDAQRQATRDAGRLAGISVRRLLAEPTAAALAYGLDKGASGTYAVYDLGGGTFDVSILKLVDGVFEVKSTGGDSALGGDDFDRLLARTMLARAGVESEAHSAQLASVALAQGKAVKQALTSAQTAEYTLPLPDGRSFSATVTRDEFATLIQPLLEKTGKACRRALRDAELRARDLDGVILVGGSTRSPAVRGFVEQVFGKPPLCDLDPDQVVALGAAAQAEMLSGGAAEVVLLDVIPLSLGIETMGGVVEKLIHRNSTIPTGAKQVFTTYADNQTGFDIHVVQGERETVDANRSLARFQLTGIPPMVAGRARIEIQFAIDADGILRVSARELISGRENSVEVTPSYGLTDEEVEHMLRDSYDHAEDDLRLRNLQVERVEAARILSATRAAMEDDAELLDDDTRRATETAIELLERAMANEDYLKIRDGISALDIASKPFAERRMTRAIRAGLRGKAVDEVEQEVAGSAEGNV